MLCMRIRMLYKLIVCDDVKNTCVTIGNVYIRHRQRQGVWGRGGGGCVGPHLELGIDRVKIIFE